MNLDTPITIPICITSFTLLLIFCILVLISGASIFINYKLLKRYHVLTDYGFKPILFFKFSPSKDKIFNELKKHVEETEKIISEKEKKISQSRWQVIGLVFCLAGVIIAVSIRGIFPSKKKGTEEKKSDDTGGGTKEEKAMREDEMFKSILKNFKDKREDN